MTAATNNMGLLKGQDGDNSRLYLTVSLAGSLDLLDGHDHSQTSGGKGKPINMIPNGLLQFSTTHERIRNPANTPTTNLAVESDDGFLMLSSLSGSHLDGNSYWDGTNWNLFNTSLGGAMWIANQNGITYNTTTAGANPRSPTTKLTIALDGTTSGKYFISSDGSNGVFQSGAGSLYLRSSGGANGVIMDTGTGGLTVTSGPITASSNVVVSGTIGTTAINSSDWYRLNNANTGIYNTPLNQGIQFTAGGQVLYPSGDVITGNTSTQTLQNKTIINGKMIGPASFGANGNDLTNYAFNFFSSTVTLPNPSAAYVGVFRAIKAWGGNITVNCGVAVLIGPGSTGVTSSFTLNNGDSATMWCDGSNWWGL